MSHAFQGKDYRKQAMLRLRNNTDCTIIVPTNDEGILMKLRRRNQPWTGIDPLTDGQEVALVYNLNHERGANETILVTDGCMVYERSLRGRESILFFVPLAHFKRGADVAVQFRYSFEDRGVSLLGGDFGHYVFFRNGSLPKQITKR